MPLTLQSKLFSALGFALLIAAWGLFAPIPLGGQAAYVIVDGNSMEPGMRRGDLAILRRADTYAVGDVVTYRHPTIGAVIHRIVGREGEGFLFKGDNNGWVDSYRPTPEELVGRLWFHLPGAGKVVELARRPPIMALLAALLIGSALMTVIEPAHAARRRKPAAAAPPAHPGGDSSWLGAALTAALACGMLAAIIAAVAFASPTTRLVAASVPFSHAGQIDYSARAPAGLYDRGAASTGDPIFRRLADEVAVRFTYSFDAELPARLEGTARLRAELSDGEGWRRTLELAPPVPVRGGSATVSGTLRLAEAQRLIDTYEELGGVARPQYLLTLVPTVELSGSVGGAALREIFAPRAEFRLDGTRLQPLAADPAAFAPQQAGALSLQREEPATLGLWLLHMDVVTVRRLALVALELAAAAVLLGWWAARAMSRGEDAAIRARYRALIVVARGAGPWAAEATELCSIDDLARAAERTGQPILRVEGDAGVGYFVRDGASVYSYHVRTGGAA